MDSFFNLVLVPPSLFLIAVSILVYYFKKPLVIKKDVSDPSLDHKSILNAPSPMPNGWVPIAPSYYVAKNKIHRSNIFNQEVILVRSASGKVHIYDAFCPHLGAHLGHQSEVVSHEKGNCIRCPFHGWLFKVDDGLVAEVPYSKNKSGPSGIKLKEYDFVERFGFIFVWYHAEGLEPTWHLPNDNNSMETGGIMEMTLNGNPRDLVENMTDNGHFISIHSSSPLFWDMFEGIWSCSLFCWLLGSHSSMTEFSFNEVNGPDGHVANSTLVGDFNIFGRRVFRENLSNEQYGPYISLLKFPNGMSGTIALLPVSGNKFTAFVIARYKPSVVKNFYSKVFIISSLIQLLRDAKIFKRKGHVVKLKIVGEEKAIAQFRKWYSQFYSENSPKSFSHSLDW